MSLNWYINRYGKDLSARRKAAAFASAILKMASGMSESAAAQAAVNQMRAETAEQREARLRREREIAEQRAREREEERARLAEIARLEAERIERERIQKLNNRKASATSEIERAIESVRSENAMLKSRFGSLRNKIGNLTADNEKCQEISFTNFDAKDFTVVVSKISTQNSKVDALNKKLDSDTREDELTKKLQKIAAATVIEDVEKQMDNMPKGQEMKDDINDIEQNCTDMKNSVSSAYKVLSKFSAVDELIKGTSRYVDIRARLIEMYNNLDITSVESCTKAFSDLDAAIKELGSIAQLENDMEAIYKINCLLSELQDELRRLRAESDIIPENSIRTEVDSKDANACYGEILKRGVLLKEANIEYKSFLRACEENAVVSAQKSLAKLNELNERGLAMSVARESYIAALERRNLVAAKLGRSIERESFSLEHHKKLIEILEADAEKMETEMLCIERDAALTAYDIGFTAMGYTAVSKPKVINAESGVKQQIYAKKGEVGTAMVVEIDMYGNMKDYAVGVEFEIQNKTYTAPKENVVSACKNTREARMEEVKRQLIINQIPVDEETVKFEYSDEPEEKPYRLESAEEIASYLKIIEGEVREENGKLVVTEKIERESGGNLASGSNNAQNSSQSSAANQNQHGQQRSVEIPKK